MLKSTNSTTTLHRCWMWLKWPPVWSLTSLSVPTESQRKSFRESVGYFKFHNIWFKKINNAFSIGTPWFCLQVPKNVPELPRHQSVTGGCKNVCRARWIALLCRDMQILCQAEEVSVRVADSVILSFEEVRNTKANCITPLNHSPQNSESCLAQSTTYCYGKLWLQMAFRLEWGETDR